MAIQAIMTRFGEIASKIFPSVTDFNPTNTPFKNQRSMFYREVGKMKPLFMLGPHRNSRVVSMGDSWNVGGLNLNSVRDRLLENGMYGILSYIPDEGGTVWGLTPDEALATKEGVMALDELIKSDIVGRRWMTAYRKASKEVLSMQNKGKGFFQKLKAKLFGGEIEPFALTFVSSVTVREIPFFGRARFSAALDKGVISFIQIPLMNDNNGYFAWKYILKDPNSMTKSDFKNEYGAGGENDYELFKKIRDFVESDACAQMNESGNYGLSDNPTPDNPSPDNPTPDNPTPDNPNPTTDTNSRRQSTGNPLLDAAYGIHPESRSLVEAYCQARGILLEDYLFEASSSLPKGKPYINKLPMESGIPTAGPLY